MRAIKEDSTIKEDNPRRARFLSRLAGTNAGVLAEAEKEDVPAGRKIARARASSSEPAKPARAAKKSRREQGLTRKKRQGLSRIFAWLAKGGAALLLAGGIFWFIHQGYLHAALEKLGGSLAGSSAGAGLSLQNVYLEGQRFTKSEAIISAMNVEIGQPILTVPIQKIRERLEKIDWIKYAVVERQLPSTLHIRVVERRPIAIWQNARQLYLMDEEGSLIVEDNLKPFSDLLILVGDDASLYAKALLHMLQEEPELYKKISSAIHIGERRWNIRFQDGMEVKLPEKDMAKAWGYIVNLYKANNLFNRHISSIDLRIADKIYIAQKPEETEEEGSSPGKNKKK